VWNCHHERSLGVVVGQREHAATPFQKSNRLKTPAAFDFQKMQDAVAHKRQLLSPLKILFACSINISFLLDPLHPQINVAQAFNLRLSMLPKRMTLVTLARK
jgi:hypothetical protein